ncbi:alpha/beta hydrolase family protein [Legionella sp. CNM-4043-24]|uniref:alpha/beta hydrolase family protein n=1 Tax=Legionella sp. CNM-4043-24 TaxID=3421646 RepID=UPI00403AC1C6
MPFLSDPWFNAQFERTIGHSSMGGADLGECLSLAAQLQTVDFNAWYDTWFALGNRLTAEADVYAQGGQHVSASAAYLRASNYLRSSFFFLDENPRDPRIESAYDQSCAAFQKAMANSDYVYRPLSIPFEQSKLPGYLFLPDNSQQPWPLILDTGGGDATKEELFFTSVVGALQRGFACLILDGPGQGAMLRKEGIPFRPDWEVVIRAVIDEVCTLGVIDPERIVLYGSSFGGYLAPRAATAEHRLAACIANPGVLNAIGGQIARLPLPVQQALSEGDDEKVNTFFAETGRSDRMKGFMFESRKVRFGVDSIADLFKKTQEYEIEQRVKSIRCPMLVLDNELEHITQGQARKLFDALETDIRHYHLFKARDGHGGHCQPLSHCHNNELIFAWLDSL